MITMRRARALSAPAFFAPVVFASALFLAACGDGGGGGGGVDGAATTMARQAGAPMAVMAESAAAPAPGGAGAPVDAVAPEGLLLAYSWDVGFSLPARNVAALKDRHEEQCRAAGPRLCLVLGGSVSGDGQDRAYGNLSLRAEPGWLEGFRAGLADSVADANGRIASQSVHTEDLTRSIVDTQARLTAQETLRERLLVLLQRPTGEVGDLLQVERELARVQGDIDSMRSQLNVMQTRVSMSALTLSYSSVSPAVSAGAFAPVMDALRGFLSVLAGSLAGVITVIAAAIPVVLILIPLIILVVRMFRGWRRRRRTGAKSA